MQTLHSSWTARHGDTSKSPVWIILNDDEGPDGGPDIDLEQWYVRAQARESVTDLNVVYGFTTSSGVELGRSKLRLGDGRVIETSTIRLVLNPSSWSEIERRAATYRIDVEVSTDATPTPAQRYTVVELDFTVVLDVTRSAGF